MINPGFENYFGIDVLAVELPKFCLIISYGVKLNEVKIFGGGLDLLFYGTMFFDD